MPDYKVFLYQIGTARGIRGIELSGLEWDNTEGTHYFGMATRLAKNQARNIETVHNQIDELVRKTVACNVLIDDIANQEFKNIIPTILQEACIVPDPSATKRVRITTAEFREEGVFTIILRRRKDASKTNPQNHDFAFVSINGSELAPNQTAVMNHINEMVSRM